MPLPGSGECFRGAVRVIALWCASWGAAIASTSAMGFSAHYLPARSLRRLFVVLGASRPLWPDGRLLLRHPFVPAGATVALVSALG